MTIDFLIDGMLSGTGVRDAINGGYVDPVQAGLSQKLSDDVSAWQRRYESAHYAGLPEDVVSSLDLEGLELTSRAKGELGEAAVGYYSHGRLKRLP
jgi:hypothetical protein